MGMREKKEELAKRLAKHKSTVPHFLHPMDNKRYASIDAHTIQEHYVKVVHTKMNLLGWTPFDVYQMQVHSNVLKDETGIPTTKISFDISPLNVVVEESAAVLQSSSRASARSLGVSSLCWGCSTPW